MRRGVRGRQAAFRLLPTLSAVGNVPSRVVTLKEELRGCGVQEMVSRIVIAFWPVILFAGICLPASAQVGSVQDATAPAELVRDTVAREVAAANDSSAKYMFRACKKTPQGSQTP